MEVKEIDGIEYIEKSQVDSLIRQRIQKVSERARKAESQASEFEKQLEETTGSAAKVEALLGQVEALQQELDRSVSKYDRHSAIAKAGFTDPSIRDAIEWAYDRETTALKAKDRPNLEDWLSELAADPSNAPAILRPHLSGAPQMDPQSTEDAAEVSLPSETVASPPNANSAAVIPPNQGDPGDLITRAMQDPEFYNANRDEIRAAWYSQQGKTAPFRF